jgi:hypothetical protein
MHIGSLGILRTTYLFGLVAEETMSPKAPTCDVLQIQFIVVYVVSQHVVNLGSM